MQRSGKETTPLLGERALRTTDHINDKIDDCCENMCGQCARCVRAIGQCCEWFGRKLANGAKEFAHMFLTPIARGLECFILNEKGKYTYTQPIVDLLMIPGNWIGTATEVIFPVKSNGKVGWPLTSLLGRAWDVTKLIVVDPFTETGSDRIKNPIAGITALALGLYVGVQAMALANAVWAAIAAGEGLAAMTATLTFDPITAFNTLLSGNPTDIQQAFVYITGFVGLTNAIAQGKKCILEGAGSWVRGFWADVNKLGLGRLLEQLSQLDAETGNQAKEQYLRLQREGKAWHVTDVVHVAMTRLLSIPAEILHLPSRALKDLTGVQGLIKSSRLAEGATNCTRDLTVGCLGWWNKKWKRPGVIGSNEAKLFEESKPAYPAVLKRQEANLVYFSPGTALAGTQGMFARGDDRLATTRRVDNHLIASLLQDVRSARLIAPIEGLTPEGYQKHLQETEPGSPILQPPYPLKSDGAVHADWEMYARQDPLIQDYLQGNFPIGQKPERLALAFETRKYEYYIAVNPTERLAHFRLAATAPSAPSQIDIDIQSSPTPTISRSPGRSSINT